MTDKEIQLEAENVFISQDSKEAIDLIRAIKRESIITDDAKIILQQLQFIRISSLNREQLLDLLRSNLLLAYSIPEYDLAERIESYVEQIELVVDQIETCRSIVTVLKTNKTGFSKESIELNGQKVDPTIGSWVADYDSYPSKDPQKGVYNQIEYINKSANVKKLSANEKEVVKNLIKLYDYCNGMVMSWEATPVPANEKEAFKDFDLHKYIPGLEEEEFEIGATPLQTASEQELEGYIPELQPQPEMPRIVRQDSIKQRPSVVDMSTPTPTPKNPVHLAAPLNVGGKARPKVGVVMDPTNIKLSDEKVRIENEKETQDRSIQRKLAELRDRHNKTNQP